MSRLTRISSVVAGTFRYELPKRADQLLFDFYTYTLIRSQLKGQKRENLGLKAAIEDVRDQLLPKLREYLLEDLWMGIDSEMSHFLEYLYQDYERENIELDEHEIIDALDHQDFNLLEEIFSGVHGEWEKHYGGKPWAQIVRGYERLLKATSEQDLIVAIDHVFDLQHNTGSALSHGRHFVGIVDDTVIDDILDVKRDSKSVYPVVSGSSPSMQRIAWAALKDIEGITKDSSDKQVSPSFLDLIIQNPKHYELTQEMKDQIVIRPSRAWKYAVNMKSRVPFVEPVLMTRPEYAVSYAGRIIRGRWPEAEKYILKSKTQAVSYAQRILQGRWPELEEEFLKTKNWDSFGKDDLKRYLKNIEGDYFVGDETIQRLKEISLGEDTSTPVGLDGGVPAG